MILEKYNPIWINHFEAIKRAIEQVLGENQYEIAHIGSTAVPNLDAKPIIDIDIIYNDLNELEFIQSRLETIGYYHNGNQGIEDREVFKRNQDARHPILDNLKHHLYVCSAHSKALERHILSRNYLRKNDEARLHYQQLKYECAERANQDRKVYQLLKEQLVNEFIDDIIAKEKKECTKL
jgi:GrpB-like predicted nucleotidyltransferase (UPF0157 family)